MKQPNNEGEARGEQPKAEVVEGSPWSEENAAQPNAGRTQSRETVSSGLSRVRQAAREGKHKQFTALLHHLSVDLLRQSYYALKRAAAPGVDGVRWQEYETGLEKRLEELHSQVHRARIARSHREESRFRKPTDGSVRWGSPRWRTRSFNRRWPPSSTRFMRRIFWDFRMVFDPGTTRIKGWTR